MPATSLVFQFPPECLIQPLPLRAHKNTMLEGQAVCLALAHSDCSSFHSPLAATPQIIWARLARSLTDLLRFMRRIVFFPFIYLEHAFGLLFGEGDEN